MQVTTETEYADEVEPEVELDAEADEAVRKPAGNAKAETQQEQEEAHNETVVWNNSEINAHSTLLSSCSATDRRDKITTFYAWLTAKK